MRLRTIHPLLLAAALAWSACGDDGGDDGGHSGDRALMPAREFEIGFTAHALGGAGDTVVAQVRDPAQGYAAILHVYHRDPALPGELVVDGDVDLLVHDGAATDLSVAEDRAALAFPAQGKVAVAAIGGPSPSLLATLDRSDVSRVAATGRWLAIASAGATPSIELVDLGGDEPVTAGRFPTGSPVTTLLAAFDGFHVFTEHGRGRLQADTEGAWSYTGAEDGTIRRFRKAELHGAEAWAAGPSPLAGRTRLTRLDVSSHLQPQVVYAVDLDGSYEDASCGGDGVCFVAVQVTDDLGTQTGAVVRADPSSGALSSVVVDVPYRVTGLFRFEATALHVSGGWLHALYAPWTEGYRSTNPNELAIFRLP